jgi:outer membrane protein assembly factor BamB
MSKIIRISLLTVIALLSFSTFVPAFVYAAPMGVTAQDWLNPNGNSWAHGYSPENQITVNNADALEVKWIFPIQMASTGAVEAIAVNEGSTTPPIVKNGQVFITTNYLRTYAVDAKNGKLQWTHDYVIDTDELESRIPIQLGGILNAHLHGISFWDDGNAVLVNGMACDFFGIDADTGDTSFWIKDLCTDVPGNIYVYRQGTAVTDGLAVWEKGEQFIFVLPGAMHSTAYVGDARHVMMGIDMDTEQVMWRVFNFPPQDVPTQDWALQECDIGFFRDIPCSDVAAVAPENLEWDWSQPGETPSVFGGVTANWGATPAIDEDTGILYTQTGNQGPYTYIGATPGPRLYGSTIMAIDLEEGKRIWWNQPMPRDPYDYDCNWDGILADVPGLGKVYMKGCKEGLLQVLDAATGEPIYIKDVVDEQISWGQITSAAASEGSEGGVKYHLMDPFSFYDMREMTSPEGSNYCDKPCVTYPYWFNGIFGTDMTYDPETGTLYHYAVALQVTIEDSPAPVEGAGSMSISSGYPIQNTSIVARDVASGDVKWTWYYDLSFIRGHMLVTSELLYTPTPEGVLRIFNKDSGQLLREMTVGSEMMVGLTSGQDSDGNQKIFTIIGTGTTQFSGILPSNPGTLIALGLSDRAAQDITTTVTTTATTTATTSTTLTTTSATTSVSTSTVTSATTSTVTSEVTEETGLPAEITYAAVAVAVIAIIAAAFLMMRKR